MSKNNTRKALLSSIVALVICCTMLMGTTFAWFTDTATVSVNVIKSGTLSIQLTDKDGNDLEVTKRALEFVKADGAPATEELLWEPGCTYNLEPLTITNNGNLTLKFKVVLTGIQGDAMLNEVIDWTVKCKGETYPVDKEIVLKPNETAEFSISGHMQETANNDYQDKTIEGAKITVMATQTPDEFDSTTNTYDMNATYKTEDGGEEEGDPIAVVTTAAELRAILNSFTDSGAGNSTVIINSNIELAEGEVWTPVTVQGYTGAGVITIEGNGHHISGLSAPLFAGGFAGASGIVINDLTIKDSTIVSTNTLGSGAFIECIDSMPTVTLNKCHLINSTVNGSRTGGLIGWTAGYNNENDGAVKTYVTVKDCSVVNCTIENTFSDDGTTPHTESVGAIFGHAGNNAWTYTTIENCEVTNTKLIGGNGKTGVILGTANVGEVTVTGCTMSGNTVNGADSNAVYGRTAFGTTGKLTIDGVAVK